LLIRMSTRPNSDNALAASASTSAFLPTSARMGTALTLRSLASRATASVSCWLARAFTTTCAPSPANFRTVARPILRPDPVTSATFPSSFAHAPSPRQLFEAEPASRVGRAAQCFRTECRPLPFGNGRSRMSARSLRKLSAGVRVDPHRATYTRWRTVRH
jgi:hypothetical protein